MHINMTRAQSTVSAVLSVILFAAAFAMALLFAAPAAADRDDERDPLQGVNRAMLTFNLKLDEYALRPTAKAYSHLPQPLRNGIGNFLSNLWQPATVLNDLLQGKFSKAGRDTGRFMINTILGAGGLMDVATHMGLPKQREDFGQTLAVWGVPPGPYLVLPFLGPANLRDFVGSIPQYAYNTDPISALDAPARWYGTGLRLVNTRARLLDLDEVLELQPDKYLFLRETYRQQREAAIYDGAPPVEDDDDLLDELLDEDF